MNLGYNVIPLVSNSSGSGSGSGSGSSLPFAAHLLAGVISDPLRSEISGIAAGDGFIWGIEDSGASATLYPFLESGLALDSIAVPGATNTDWEDIASDGGNLYVADFGNNGQGARAYKFYRIPEPAPEDVLAGTASITATEVVVTFGVGGTQVTPDVEAVIVRDGTLYAITKRNTLPEVYRLDDADTVTGPQVLTYVGTIPGIPNDSTEGYAANVVGADATAEEITLITYNGPWRNPVLPGETFEEALMGTYHSYTDDGLSAWHGTTFDTFRKCESICYNAAGDLLAVGERDGGAVPDYIFKRSRRVVTEKSFQNGVDGYTGTTDTFIDQAAPTVNSSTAATFDIDSGPNAREGMIHFDAVFGSAAGQVGADDEIVGGYLELKVTDTGSGIAAWEALVDWVGSVATMTWNTNPFGGGSAVSSAATTAESSIGRAVSGNHVPTGTIRLFLSAALLEKWRTVNHGLILLPNYPSGSSGLGASTSNHSTVANRPKLVVYVS